MMYKLIVRNDAKKFVHKLDRKKVGDFRIVFEIQDDKLLILV